MYAIVRSGSKQHRVAKGEHVKVEKLLGDVGTEVKLDEVLLIGGSGDARIGRPRVEGAVVTAKIVAQGKERKIRVLRRRRRTGYTRCLGHRQPYTEIEITGIEG